MEYVHFGDVASALRTDKRVKLYEVYDCYWYAADRHNIA